MRNQSARTILILKAAALAAAGLFSWTDAAHACPDVWDPVCGVNGVTYSNTCYAGSVELACEGECPCWQADRVFGQKNLTETAYNEVVANRLFHPAGVLIDRMPAPQPSRVLVWDSGNNRILGFNSIGTCSGGSNPGTACTENSICTGGGKCTANLNQPAARVFGQADATSASCNRNNTTEAAAANNRLCTVPYPYQISPLEGPRGNSMAVDAQHNLYTVDPYNNRILRYDNPFQSDTQADWTFGQSNYTNRLCNRGQAQPSATTLCTGELQNFYPNYYFEAGLDATDDGAYVWVADLGNHRVLRVHTATSTADRVIGQPNFTSRQPDCDLNPPHDRLCKPNSVQFDEATGRLYVLHGDENGLIFVYYPPLVNGMAPTAVYGPPAGSSFKWARGLTLDPATPNAFWVNDTDNSRVLQYVNGVPTRVLSKADFTTTGCIGGLQGNGTIYPQVCSPHGTVGIDRDGSVYVGDLQEEHVERFPAPIPLPNPPIAHSPDARLWYEGPDKANHLHINRVSAKGLANPGYALIVGNQLVIADRQRIVFWTDYAVGKLTGGPASGVLAQPGFDTQADQNVTHGRDFTALAHDPTRRRLYATHGPYITAWDTTSGLVSGAPYVFQIQSPLPALGGSSVSFEANGIAVDAATDSAWISDSAKHRILRILNVSQPTRVVDAVVGQPSLAQTVCNRGTGLPGQGGILSANSFCIPTQTTYDPFGNLYVVDGTWEGNGNKRVLQFAAGTMPPMPSPQLVWSTGGPMADRVYAKASFSATACDPDPVNHPCVPRFVSFEPGTNRMVLSVDAYSNPLTSRVFLYNDPNASTAPTPDNHIRLPFNQAAASTWDTEGRLAILDHTWNRALLFHDPPATPANCRNHDGNVESCDAAAGCAYYFCSDQCHPVGTSNCAAGCPEYC